jgi:hypothetical protein
MEEQMRKPLPILIKSFNQLLEISCKPQNCECKNVMALLSVNMWRMIVSMAAKDPRASKTR